MSVRRSHVSITQEQQASFSDSGGFEVPFLPFPPISPPRSTLSLPLMRLSNLGTNTKPEEKYEESVGICEKKCLYKNDEESELLQKKLTETRVRH